MQPFRANFTASTWRHVLVLIAGAILAPGGRTVASALRVAGLDQDPHFTNFHRVLNRNRWRSRAIACQLLRLLVSAFAPEGPVIVGLDETLERRWGSKISARGIYRDAVRSSHGHFVKASGLRWVSVMLLPDISWAGRVWALPFLTALAPFRTLRPRPSPAAQETHRLGKTGATAGRTMAARPRDHCRR